MGLAVLAASSFLLASCGGGDDISTPPPLPLLPSTATELTPSSLSMEKVAGYTHTGGLGAAEISGFDPISRRLFVVNGAQSSVDVLGMASTGTGASATLSVTLVGLLTSSQFGAGLGGVNSVAIYNGIVALAVEAATKTDAGIVAFVRASDLQVIGTRTVGALPDMLTFSPDGKFLLVANEGEPNSYGQVSSIDPEGSVSVIEIAGLSPTASTLQTTLTTAGFTAFNTQAASLRMQGVRLPGIGTTTVAQDLEPEYITIADDNRTAWISLQENNAITVLDIPSKTITSIRALGLKDHSLSGNGLDVSNEDGGTNTNSGTPTIKISNYPIKGMYMPDGIASFRTGTRTFIATANEGDAREYTGVNSFGRDDPRVRDFCSTGFDSSVYGTLTATMGFDSFLGRLRVDAFAGANRTGKNASGQCNELVAFGARSLSIWDADNFGLVWDSGDQLEQRTALLNPTFTFNASNDNNTLDDRSPAKGPEPESVITAKFGTKTFAFVGLERVGGVMVYDVSNPAVPVYVTYLNTRTGTSGDRGPEGLLLVKAADSPSGKPLLIVSNETSGTTAVFQINLQY
ncbi:choice-of-anchor I family protein [Variovorax sp. PCZ-1]|nr:choice-of-anchor I family protein [Variovorax sp. PCZ-1]